MYVSFDDGEHWQSLRLNMPATSIRDLVIKDDDIVVGTHGRSFWILDNMTSLRQLVTMRNNSYASSDLLFKPQTAFRIRWNMNTDTPLPQEEPAGENPPDGAMIEYYLHEDAREVKIEVYEKSATGLKEVCHYSSNDTLMTIPPNNVPPYWLRPQQLISTKKGSQRFLWDMHYQPLPVSPGFPIAATFENTAPSPSAPWVMPGDYLIKLIVGTKTYSQNITVKMDPRVKTKLADLQLQHDLSMIAYEGRKQTMDIASNIAGRREVLKTTMNSSANRDRIRASDSAYVILQNGTGKKEIGINRLNGTFAFLFDQLQDSDWPPTSQQAAAVKDAQLVLQKLTARWKELEKQ